MESSESIRFNKLYYPGSGMDIKPLPAAKSAVYVDLAPENWILPADYKKMEVIEVAEKMVEEIIVDVNKKYQLIQKPVVNWTKSENEKPVAKVLFTWGEMPGLTKKGDLTNLIYFFQTDTDVPSTQLKKILEDTDIIWISHVSINPKSFSNIDLSKNPLLLTVAEDFLHTYDLVRMRKTKPKNQFLDSSRMSWKNRRDKIKFTKEVPKLLKRLRLKLLLPFPEVLHPCTYEDWYNDYWKEDWREDWKNWGKNAVYDATLIFLMLILSFFMVQFSLTRMS